MSHRSPVYYLPFFAVLLLALPAAAQSVAAPDPIALIMRWVHILSAITMLGGSIFVRFVLSPAAAGLSDDSRTTLIGGIRARWSKFLMVLIALFLVSGFYNYLMVTAPAHKGQPQYHMVMGIKMLLAFVVFFLASALAGRRKLAQKLQSKAAVWMLITVLLGVAIVLLSGYLRFMPTTTAG